MLLPADQRRLLGAFLRARREALSPADVDLPAAGRRRTPGLRREEVAQLSGLSATWYSWAEQGRDIAFSEAALSRLAAALRLTAAERAYLFELTRRRDPAIGQPGTRQGSETELGAIVSAITVPAYAMDRFWTVECWNESAGRLLAPWFDEGDRNLLRFVFLHPVARHFICDWDDRARRVVAEFRADTARDPDNPEYRALVSTLLAGSSSFAHLWTGHAVQAREGGVRLFDHPLDGALAFTQVTLTPAAQPGYRIVMLLPAAANETAGCKAFSVR